MPHLSMSLQEGLVFPLAALVMPRSVRPKDRWERYHFVHDGRTISYILFCCCSVVSNSTAVPS